LALACSFGEIEGNDGLGTPLPPVEQGGGSEQPGGGTDVAPPVNNTDPTVTPPPETGEEGEEYSGEDPFQSELGKEVRQILEVNCGRCHEGTNYGDMDYILDLEELVKNNKVVPGNKEDSQLFVRMQQQSMPPAFERVQRPTFGQIDQVGQFIDELDPEFGGARTDCNELPFFNHDDQIAAMANDISRVDEQDQPFTRYLTITYSSNAGDCDRAVQRQRYALFKGINSVSTEAQVGVPQPIDEDETIFRIDIRDYDWDRQIDLEDDGIVDFDDAWLAIVDGVGEYAVEFTGDQADDLVQDTQTAVPFLPVNAFVQFTELDDLYYALIGARANLFDFELDVLGIDTEAEIADDNLLRAGFSNSGVSKQERVLNRFDQNTASGYAYWISFDFDNEAAGNESIYQDPIDFNFAGGEAIFNLPNGFQAYYVANAAGDRLNEAPVGVVIDPAQNNGVVTNGASCHSCHNAGMITFTDTVRQFVVDNRTLFNNDTFEDVMNQYPSQAEFQRAMDADSELHVAAVERAGVPRRTPDPVSRVFLDFQLGNIDATIAAGELQVDREVLLDNLDLLDPQLVNLGEEGGYVDRDIFTANYLDSFCVLHSVDENQPANCP
jgi:serine/threonine-protein kinase